MSFLALKYEGLTKHLLENWPFNCKNAITSGSWRYRLWVVILARKFRLEQTFVAESFCYGLRSFVGGMIKFCSKERFLSDLSQ